SAGTTRQAGPAELSASASAWTGSVRGMIVWLPDFTFRWSPRNVDVLRRGADLRGEAAFPAARLRASASWSYARVTYADPAAAGLQLAYRPRNSGLLAATWAPGRWRGELGARYTGRRYPA